MRIIFMGRRPHAIEALAWLIDEGHDVVRVVCPSGSGDEIPYWSPTVRDFALSAGLPVTTAQEIYHEVSSESSAIDLGDIDLIVSFLFWRKIREPLIGLGRYGCVNFHPAPLPEYKGLGGYNFAILHRLDEWGVTAHYVDAEIDTGPIISIERFPFDWQHDTALSLEMKTRPRIVQLFKNVIVRFGRDGRLEGHPNTGGHYYTREDMELAKRIDLGQLSEDEIDLRVRAFWYPPFDGAYITAGDRRYTLASAAILGDLGRGIHLNDLGQAASLDPR